MTKAFSSSLYTSGANRLAEGETRHLKQAAGPKLARLVPRHCVTDLIETGTINECQGS